MISPRFSKFEDIFQAFCFCNCMKNHCCCFILLRWCWSICWVHFPLWCSLSYRLQKAHVCQNCLKTNKQIWNWHFRLHHWHLLASHVTAPILFTLQHFWSRDPNKQQLNALPSSVCRVTGVSWHDYMYQPSLANMLTQGFFCYQTNLISADEGPRAHSSGVSRSKRELGYFEAGCICGLCSHWDVATTVASFLLKYFLKKGWKWLQFAAPGASIFVVPLNEKNSNGPRSSLCVLSFCP